MKCKRAGYTYLAVFLIVILFGWWGTNKMMVENTASSLEAALLAAGENRTELEKVLNCYLKHPKDSLKYKAACFLIENMPFYAYSTSEQLENYKLYFAWLKKSEDKTPEQVLDSVKKVFGPMWQVEKKRDIQEIDSAYLCNNIEWAFKVWEEQPWGKNVSFDTFKEDILPYRIGEESLTYWREMYYNKYNPLLDSLRMSDSLDIEDPCVVADYLRKHLPDQKHYFTSITPYPYGNIGPEYAQYISGSCREAADFGVYLYRALGIPCTVDFFPLRYNVSAGHFWLVHPDKNGEMYAMEFPREAALIRKNNWSKSDDSPKVYRHTFSVNRELYKEMIAHGEELYPFWRVPKFIDVTSDYSYYWKKELKIPSSLLYKNEGIRGIAYLCLSNRDRWIPIDWTACEGQNIVFHNVRIGAVMRVATYEGGKMHFLTNPFYIDKRTTEFCCYSAGDDKEDVVAYAKCSFSTEMYFRRQMQGGVFEGSNSPDFADKDTLYIIQEPPSRLCTVVQSWSNKEYRYLRYVGPEILFCGVAEVAFYGLNDTIPLKGKIMGAPWSKGQDSMHDLSNVFDGKTWTSYNSSRASGDWVGMDIGKKVRVSKIVYTPRNMDNYICPGDNFELFYCDRDWVSVGKVQAVADSLVFRDVPKNALLLLRNYSRGVDERIFTYKNGCQVWK